MLKYTWPCPDFERLCDAQRNKLPKAWLGRQTSDCQMQSSARGCQFAFVLVRPVDLEPEVIKKIDHGKSFTCECHPWQQLWQAVQVMPADSVCPGGHGSQACETKPSLVGRELHYQSTRQGSPVRGCFTAQKRRLVPWVILGVCLLYQGKCSWSCSLLFPTLETMDHHHVSNLNSDFQLVSATERLLQEMREGCVFFTFFWRMFLPLEMWGWGLLTIPNPCLYMDGLFYPTSCPLLCK